jgi:hypothetical protein
MTSQYWRKLWKEDRREIIETFEMYPSQRNKLLSDRKWRCHVWDVMIHASWTSHTACDVHINQLQRFSSGASKRLARQNKLSVGSGVLIYWNILNHLDRCSPGMSRLVRVCKVQWVTMKCERKVKHKHHSSIKVHSDEEHETLKSNRSKRSSRKS